MSEANTGMLDCETLDIAGLATEKLESINHEAGVDRLGMFNMEHMDNRIGQGIRIHRIP